LGEDSYNIIIGSKLLSHAGENIKPLLKSTKVIIITDSIVEKLYLKALKDQLKGLEVFSIILPSGEKTKSFKYLEKICEDILNIGIDRKTTLIALGGGVIGDITGFAAGILLRGIDFIQIPTTLLAMVDSSVGGKTAINARAGKNLVGLFNQPKLVLCDTSLLKSLPKREVMAGFAEVAKYGIILDKAFFEYLEKLKTLEDGFDYMVLKSCEIKARVVEGDEKEQNGLRELLNFGHTLGHALEGKFGKKGLIIHGEAVSIGMAFASYLSFKQGLIKKADYNRIVAFMQQKGLPTKLNDVFSIKEWKASSNYQPESPLEADLAEFLKPPPTITKELIEYIKKDKKVKNNQIKWILIGGVGVAG
jgi:3-dehydroquinate synthase